MTRMARLILIIAAVAVIGYSGYVGMVGSEALLRPERAAGCATPATAQSAAVVLIEHLHEGGVRNNDSDDLGTLQSDVTP
jgi:hypothetical protein